MRAIPTVLRTTARIPLRLSSTSAQPPPLVRLQNARLNNPASPHTSISLDWTINDAGADECWAIIAPASEHASAIRHQLISILSGHLRPRLATSNLQHPPLHPFLQETPGEVRNAIRHVSFATRFGSGSASAAGEFTNYSARYGAIRDQDRVTLYERLMDVLGCPVGLVAAQKLVPDPFSTHANHVGLFKYRSNTECVEARRKAQVADGVIRSMAPMVMITDELLRMPLIALSNGQTRRARILSSLITGAQLVILEEPFSGIDAHTRKRLGGLFAQLHTQRTPRLVLVLREQDALPQLVTHVLVVDELGNIASIGRRDSTASITHNQHDPTPTGVDVIRSNAESNVGRGDTSVPALISLKSVCIVYGENKVLDAIDLEIHPGMRLVLAGDNGSGKTTLLALLLGDHPKSFSFASHSLSLFSHARDHPSNARTLLNRRLGHLSPELFNAFPRRPLSTGGLTVAEVIASGFENVFARTTYTRTQKHRVWRLLAHFSDVIRSASGGELRQVGRSGFAELSHGSQAVVLFLRAVVANPQVLVLDEPFQGMDTRQVERTTEYVDRPERFAIGSNADEVRVDLEERRRMAVVLVSHYEAEWPSTFGCLLRLSQGKIVQRI